jgi:hypothetical protein
MRITLPLIALSTAAVGHALSLSRRDAPRVLAAPLERRQLTAGLARRDSSYLNVSLENNVRPDISVFLTSHLIGLYREAQATW